MAGDLPTGVVTLLFTDVEGSTRLWEEHPDVMPAVLAQHDALLRAAVEAGGGTVVKSTGDGTLAAFADATAAYSRRFQVLGRAQGWTKVALKLAD